MSIYDKASLVLIPSGTNTSKVYSQKPVNGDGDFTFSRSTGATRVNADGLIEKETQNLLLQSNSFPTASWDVSSVTLTGSQSGYDGSSDAWKLESNVTNANIFQIISTSGVSTFSVYAKAGNASWIRLRYDNNSTTDVNLWCNLTDGSLGVDSGVSSYTENIGGGWYRIVVQANTNDLNNLRIYPATSNGGNSNAGDNIYIQDAQLNQGLIAQEVITTTTTALYGGITDNVPRLDYTDSSCPALLLEPQRSNLVPFSEHLESSDWAKTRCTIEDNSTTSPEGVINASKMTSTDASESYIQDNLTTTGTKVTWSFFAKKGDLDYAYGLVWDLSANGCRQWFNLSTGAVGGTTTFGSGYSVDSATIEDYGNGWYRCAMVVNSTAGTQGCRVSISSADTTISSAVNSYGYFYGLQAEDASYATSYIPTYGTSVTRNADSCLKTGISSLIGQTEGTLFFDFYFDAIENGGRIIAIGSGNTNDRILIRFRPTGYLAYASSGGVFQWSHEETTITLGNHKMAIAYAQNDVAFYVDGTLINSESTYTTPTTDDVFIGTSEYGGVENTNIKVNQALLFKTRLSNEELAALTTI